MTQYTSYWQLFCEAAQSNGIDPNDPRLAQRPAPEKLKRGKAGLAKPGFRSPLALLIDVDING